MNAAPQSVPPTPGRSPLRLRLKAAWDLEFSHFSGRLMACGILARLLPEGRATSLRTWLVRAVGLDVGARTRFLGMPTLQSSPGPLRPRFSIGADCVVGRRVILEFGERLSLGDRVTVGDRVVILTTTHELGPREFRAGKVTRNPVSLGDDVTIGEGAIILPGVEIGAGARVMPGSVVNSKVAAGATVSGIPARPQRPPQQARG